FYEDKDKSETGLVGKDLEYEFFELALGDDFLKSTIEEDAPYSDQLMRHFHKENYQAASQMLIGSAMLNCMNSMKHWPFSGNLRQLYLESKASELFLLQVDALVNAPAASMKLRPRDMECLREAKLFIEQNYQTPCKIIDLARIVGINQTKLKRGFKEYF